MKSEFTCIIVDDEEFAIGLLAANIEELYNNVTITGTYTKWKDALEALRNTKPDILFLDMAIEGKNGLDILKLVPGIESEVIIVSAYSEYAIEAFKFSATGYILKPVRQTELGQMMDKAIERITNRRAAKLFTNDVVPVSAKIAIPNGKGVNYFDPKDIVYFEAINSYTKVVARNSELMSAYNLGKYHHVLDNKLFFQVHRSYIVNLQYITRYESAGTIIMVNKKEIPVARNLKEDFLKLFRAL